MEHFQPGRRKFIKNSAAGVAAITLGLSGFNSFASPAKNSKVNHEAFDTGFEQKPLPYSYNALEDVIDAMTMEIHYSKHAATYSKNLNEAAKAEGVDAKKTVEDLLASISKYSVKMRNNAGGHFNHEMFWQCMKPKTMDNAAKGTLLKAIEKSFNSFDAFRQAFTDVGKNRFGSGWAWLYVASDKTLKIGSSANQDNPLMDVSDIKGYPLLGLDVWEHAYYLKYQNKRADYIDSWWKVVNWDYVQQRFEKL